MIIIIIYVYVLVILVEAVNEVKSVYADRA